MSWLRILTVVAATALMGAMALPAGAAPLGAGAAKSVASTESATTQVHYRSYRHCHRRHGRRYCHGHHRAYRSYGWPGIGLYFGTGRRHHGGHHGHHGHHRGRMHH
jgi:hypothetical protein